MGLIVLLAIVPTLGAQITGYLYWPADSNLARNSAQAGLCGVLAQSI